MEMMQLGGRPLEGEEESREGSHPSQSRRYPEAQGREQKNILDRESSMYKCLLADLRKPQRLELK